MRIPSSQIDQEVDRRFDVGASGRLHKDWALGRLAEGMKVSSDIVQRGRLLRRVLRR